MALGLSRCLIETLNIAKPLWCLGNYHCLTYKPEQILRYLGPAEFPGTQTPAEYQPVQVVPVFCNDIENSTLLFYSAHIEVFLGEVRGLDGGPRPRGPPATSTNYPTERKNRRHFPMHRGCTCDNQYRYRREFIPITVTAFLIFSDAVHLTPLRSYFGCLITALLRSLAIIVS